MQELATKRLYSRPSAGNGTNGATRFLQRINPVFVEQLQFIAGFVRRPGEVLSVTPSSAALARAMLKPCNLKHAKLVIELGPGTGAFTRFILQQIGPRTTYLGFELNEAFARQLRQRFPTANIVHDSAENLVSYLPRSGRQKADCILSGLPWAGMNSQTQDRILEAIFAGLKTGGTFTAMGYIHAWWFPACRLFRQKLEYHFQSVSITPIVWANVPPAFAYVCR